MSEQHRLGALYNPRPSGASAADGLADPIDRDAARKLIVTATQCLSTQSVNAGCAITNSCDTARTADAHYFELVISGATAVDSRVMEACVCQSPSAVRDVLCRHSADGPELVIQVWKNAADDRPHVVHELVKRRDTHPGVLAGLDAVGADDAQVMRSVALAVHNSHEHMADLGCGLDAPTDRTKPYRLIFDGDYALPYSFVEALRAAYPTRLLGVSMAAASKRKLTVFKLARAGSLDVLTTAIVRTKRSRPADDADAGRPAKRQRA